MAIGPQYLIPDPGSLEPPTVVTADPTPEEWIARLWKRLNDRAARIQLYEDYYNGKQRLRFTTMKMRQTFGTEFGAFADNFCALVVDAVEERIQIRGFRVLEDEEEETPEEEAAETPEQEEEEEEGENVSDDLAWEIWRHNDLETGSQMAHVEALVNEESYILVWFDPDDATMPQITVESPFEVIVDFDAANRRKRRAALKRWVDPDDGRWRAVLYRADFVYKYISAKKARDRVDVSRAGFWEQWQPDGDPDWPLENRLQVVPVIPLTNKPRQGGGGDSEIKDAIPIQDALNKTVIDMLISSEFTAYPQRVIIGAEVPKDENDQPIEPLKAGANRWLFLKTDAGSTINPSISQLPQASLDPYTNAISSFISHLGSITKTPKHYLIDVGGGTNLSGETLKALEAGLVAKARRKTRTWAPGWAEAMALGYRVIELGSGGEKPPTTDKERIEVIWGDVESRTEAQHVDALLKLGTLDVPTEQLWSDAGYTPQQIKRFKKMRKTSPPPTQAVRVTEPVAPVANVTEATGMSSGAPATPAPVPAGLPAVNVPPRPPGQ